MDELKGEGKVCHAGESCSSQGEKGPDCVQEQKPYQSKGTNGYVGMPRWDGCRILL